MKGGSIRDRCYGPDEFSTGGVGLQDDVKVTAAVVPHPPVTPSFAYRFEHPSTAPSSSPATPLTRKKWSD